MRCVMGWRASGLPWMCAVAVLSVARMAVAESKPITRLIPADCVIAYFSKPYAESAATSKPTSRDADEGESGRKEGSQLASIINFLNLSGLIPDEGQVFAD